MSWAHAQSDELSVQYSQTCLVYKLPFSRAELMPKVMNYLCNTHCHVLFTSSHFGDHWWNGGEELISYGTCKHSQGCIYMIYKPLKMICLLRLWMLSNAQLQISVTLLENINLEEIKVLDQCWILFFKLDIIYMVITSC